MNLEIVLVGVSIHALFWEHLPHWGTWYGRLIDALPKPLRSLYELWRCPYCAGFWIALSLHGATGIWTWPALAGLPAFWGPAAIGLGWILDALLTAICIKLSMLVMHALSLPAMRGYMMKPDFLAFMASASEGQKPAKS